MDEEDRTGSNVGKDKDGTDEVKLTTLHISMLSVLT